MSLVLITEHDENIYNSTKKQTTYHKKSPRYVSIHKEFVKADIHAKHKIGTGHSIMGVPRHPLPSPADFLKKHQGIRHKLESRVCHSKCDSKLVPVPITSELLKEAKAKKKKPEENYVSKNIKYAVTLKPKDPVKKIAIRQDGVTKKLSEGLEPRFMFSETFGKIPEYLARLIKENEKTMQFKKDTTGTEQPKCHYITRDERDTLLAGLKENWEELQKDYQGLPILTDTIPKMHRKSKLESELKQLEKDIVLLERHPYIYVYNDNDLS